MVRRRRVIALELAVERVLMHTAESHRTSRRITGTTADVSATGRKPTVAASRTMAATDTPGSLQAEMTDCLNASLCVRRVRRDKC